MPEHLPTGVGSKTIRVDVEVFQYIKDRGEPLSETPNDVLRREFKLTGHDPRYAQLYSFQARLLRLGKLLEASDGAVDKYVRDELKAIHSAHAAGVFV